MLTKMNIGGGYLWGYFYNISDHNSIYKTYNTKKDIKNINFLRVLKVGELYE